MSTRCEHTRRVTFDPDRQRFLCRLGGPGDPIVETETLAAMTDFLDSLSLRVRTPSIIDVILRKKTRRSCWDR